MGRRVRMVSRPLEARLDRPLSLERALRRSDSYRSRNGPGRGRRERSRRGLHTTRPRPGMRYSSGHQRGLCGVVVEDDEVEFSPNRRRDGGPTSAHPAGHLSQGLRHQPTIARPGSGGHVASEPTLHEPNSGGRTRTRRLDVPLPFPEGLRSAHRLLLLFHLDIGVSRWAHTCVPTPFRNFVAAAHQTPEHPGVHRASEASFKRCSFQDSCGETKGGRHNRRFGLVASRA